MEKQDKNFFKYLQMMRELKLRIAFMQINREQGERYYTRARQLAIEEAKKIGCDQNAINALFKNQED